MLKNAFEPCIPTRGTKVPDRPEWIHEIKHDGYRLIIQRDGKRVRLCTRNGHDWSNRYPLIVEAALQNRSTSFVIDGEAVLLGVDGRSDFNGLHSRQRDDEVQFYAFDMLVSDGDDLRKLPLSMRKTNLARLNFRFLPTALNRHSGFIERLYPSDHKGRQDTQPHQRQTKVQIGSHHRAAPPHQVRFRCLIQINRR